MSSQQTASKTLEKALIFSFSCNNWCKSVHFVLVTRQITIFAPDLWRKKILSPKSTSLSIQKFIQTTDAAPIIALQYLNGTKWDLQAAIDDYVLQHVCNILSNGCYPCSLCFHDVNLRYQSIQCKLGSMLILVPSRHPRLKCDRL